MNTVIKIALDLTPVCFWLWDGPNQENKTLDIKRAFFTKHEEGSGMK